MKKRLLAFAATLAILGGGGAVLVSQVHAQTPPTNAVQPQPQSTTGKSEPSESEANDKGKTDNDNVQEGDQHDTAGAPEVPDNQ